MLNNQKQPKKCHVCLDKCSKLASIILTSQLQKEDFNDEFGHQQNEEGKEKTP